VPSSFRSEISDIVSRLESLETWRTVPVVPVIKIHNVNYNYFRPSPRSYVYMELDDDEIVLVHVPSWRENIHFWTEPAAINRLRVVRTVDTPEELARRTHAKNPREEPARGTRFALSSKVATKIAIKLHKKEIRIFCIRPRRTLTMPSRTRRARRSCSNAPPPMGPRTKLFLDALAGGMAQAGEDWWYAGVRFPASIAFTVPAEHKPDGMGVASVSEAGIEMPCGGSFPFEDGDKFKENTPESLACLLLGSILSGNPITVRCPECEKDTCSRCGHVRN